MKTPEDVKKLRSKASRILKDEGWAEYEGYSGRCMYGAKSSFALTTSVHPNSPEGQRLRRAGLSSDNMGLDYIYYTTD